MTIWKRGMDEKHWRVLSTREGEDTISLKSLLFVFGTTFCKHLSQVGSSTALPVSAYQTPINVNNVLSNEIENLTISIVTVYFQLSLGQADEQQGARG